MDCESLCGGGYGGGAGDALDGLSIREVMEALRGVSHDELINQLEGIGFKFNEQDIVRQMNKFDIESKRRIMRIAG